MIRTLDQLSFSRARGFLVIEGVNGAGKGTLITKLRDLCTQHGSDVLFTREPGATLLGQSIRSLLLDSPGESRTHLAESFLFAADRADHVERLIKPALHEGRRVISDRFYYSTVAFQGYGRGLSLSALNTINEIAIDGLTPDVVLLLDVDAEEGLRRTSARGQQGPLERDSFEAEELSFHERIREGFLEIADSSSEQFVVIDASKDATQVFEQARPVVERWLHAVIERPSA